MNRENSHIKILYYHFTPQEVLALYELIMGMGWIPRKNPAVTDVVNRVCKLAESDELATANHKTT